MDFNSNFYEKLLLGGAYSLPYLLHLWNDDLSLDIYLINDEAPLSYNGHVYGASTFEFTPSDSGESTLNISVIDNGMKMLLDGSRFFHAQITGILLENNSVAEIRDWKRCYGSGEWDSKTVSLSFESDDRLSMTFPALIFNGDNNRGNT